MTTLGQLWQLDVSQGEVSNKVCGPGPRRFCGVLGGYYKTESESESLNLGGSTNFDAGRARSWGMGRPYIQDSSRGDFSTGSLCIDPLGTCLNLLEHVFVLQNHDIHKTTSCDDCHFAGRQRQ